MTVVDFLPTQNDASSATYPLPFTGSPFELLWSDIKLFFRVLVYLWGVVVPIYPYGSGELDELYPSFDNVKALILHAILIVSQTFFILTIPFWFLYPLPLNVLVVYLVMFWMFNGVICRWLNGDGKPLTSRVPMDGWEKREGEKWVFMNGISIGNHWLQSNIDRLAMTFRREVTGVHNLTAGIIFDIIQCLIERDFCYNTGDSRQAYHLVKEALRDPANTKVIVILHSQGAIEGALMIDWLLADLPQILFRKLEVYTFGAAANHFNNPTLSDVPARSPIRTRRGSLWEEPEKRVIRHIEHYANQGDFVARWGVLNFTKGAKYRYNRFAGQLFEYKGATGHLLCQHYLDYMFAWDKEGMVAESNAFMDSMMDVERIIADQREGENALNKMENGTETVGMKPVKELSRLWKYRNGMSPVGSG
ncbi:hypothetical protein GP486_002484 [Trichoglossum hirsutum]|uniref:DUF676 domain-containing protein n=1 Tax=Trichoglossum hirsutum TaxID=265104 RepID=A0A9P8LE74_9PEZI|nr:hypothetical protein GP486_002484 [Trichoglossum hirsutum]